MKIMSLKYKLFYPSHTYLVALAHTYTSFIMNSSVLVLVTTFSILKHSMTARVGLSILYFLEWSTDQNFCCRNDVQTFGSKGELIHFKIYYLNTLLLKCSVSPVIQEAASSSIYIYGALSVSRCITTFMKCLLFWYLNSTEITDRWTYSLDLLLHSF